MKITFYFYLHLQLFTKFQRFYVVSIGIVNLEDGLKDIQEVNISSIGVIKLTINQIKTIPNIKPSGSHAELLSLCWRVFFSRSKNN